MSTKRNCSTAMQMHAVLGAIVFGLAGCDAFNPSFLSLVAPGVAATSSSVPNPPGYVIVALQNNVTVDGQLVNWLRSRGADISAGEQQNLRARIRLRLRITHADQTFQVVEMISGTENLVDPQFAAQASPDLNQNTLMNVVVRCDVISIQQEPGTDIEVFIPSPIEGWELVEIREGDDVGVEPQLRFTNPPQFQALQVDDVDEDGNVILRRNIDVRDVLSPIPNVVCGSVIAVVVEGVLTVPFFSQATTNNPSFNIDDEPTIAGIGGRYEFRVGNF